MKDMNLPIFGYLPEKHNRIDYEFPISYYENNLIFNKDGCWACYEIEGFTYEYKSDAEKISKHNSLTRLLWTLGLEGHIRVIPKISSIRQKNENLKKRCRGSLKETALKEIDLETENLINFIGDEGNDYEQYLLIKLDKPMTFKDVKEFFASVIQDPVRKINELAGVRDFEIYLREIEAYSNLENSNFIKMNKYQRMARTNEVATEYIARHLFYFGIGVPPIRSNNKGQHFKPQAEITEIGKKKYLRPFKKDVLTLSESDINIENSRHLEITQFYKGREVKAYQSYIIISDIPDIDIPGDEWLYNLLSITDFPLNISIRFKIIKTKVAKSQVEKRKQYLTDQKEHIKDTGNIPIDLAEKDEEAQLIEYDLKNRQFPLLRTTIIIGVAAKDKETLFNRVEVVRNNLGSIQSEVPSGDQFLLFNEMLPGGKQYVTDYILMRSPEFIAASMFGATDILGDPEGLYMAVTGALNKPVRIDLSRASQINKSPCFSAIGAQGGGKSHAVDTIALKTCKYTGAKGLWLDPKGDRSNWPDDLVSYQDEVNVITFTAKQKDKGQLDAYCIFKSFVKTEGSAEEIEDDFKEKMNEASALALDILKYLVGVKMESDEVTHLLRATGRVAKRKDAAMNKVIEELKILENEYREKGDIQSSNDCLKIVNRLDAIKEQAYSQLLFGDGDEKAIDFENQINVLQIQNLVLPDHRKKHEDYNFSETIGYACLLGITGYIDKFIKGDRSQLKIFIMDEQKVLESTPLGKNVLSKIRRMARALNTPGGFISQSVGDIGDEAEKNNIGQKFAFQSTDADEISNILRFFNIENTESNRNVIMNLGNGQCLYQDLEGRVGVINIDSVFEELYIALNTTPEEQQVS